MMRVWCSTNDRVMHDFSGPSGTYPLIRSKITGSLWSDVRVKKSAIYSDAPS